MRIEERCDNRTVMTVRCFAMDDRHGREVVAVVAKLCWKVSPQGAATLAVPQPAIRVSDMQNDYGPFASTRLPSDMVDEKPGTDVLLIGHAYPPAAKRVTEHDVSLRIETGHKSIQKTVRVYGPRVYYQGTFGVTAGPSAPLEKTPLLYELAVGGVDKSDPTKISIDHKNPSGRGYARDRDRLIGSPAHQIEDPLSPDKPAGFGPLGPFCSPRIERAGTYDEGWRKRRAPVRPRDFDPRHNAVAPPDLWSEAPLVGDEPVEITGATEEGVWRFRLPRYAPLFSSVQNGVATDHTTHLDTFLIDADARTVEVCFRVSIPLPRKSEQLEAILVRPDGELPSEVTEALQRDLAAYETTAAEEEEEAV